MKTITRKYKVYEYNELSEDAKEKAIELLYDININYEWYEFIYEDAEQIGLKITSFDIERGSYCRGNLIWDVEEIANAIIKNHGESCETYKTAESYLRDRNAIIDTVERDESGDFIHTYELDNKLDKLDREFEYSIFEDYRIILQHEYEYLTSRESIEEMINANEYQFTEDGKIFH
jgi:hypothetical protein